MVELKDYQVKMEKTITALEELYSTVRAGRVNPKILNKIVVEYYGSNMPINQLAGISVPEARTIMIQPWEISVLKDIEKAIQTSDIGVMPTNDGKVIRLTFPELTEDRRKEIVKEVKKNGEDSKVAIRNIRREAVDKVKKAEKSSEISKDEMLHLDDEIQKMTDKHIKKIDELVEKKSKEIMTV